MAHNKHACRWAALSLSSIAQVFLSDIQLPNDKEHGIRHELVAVSSTKPSEAAREWLDKNEIGNARSVEVWEDWQQMLQRADFDVVYISTPHALHYQHARKALELKRHVLVEKPATMNAAQYASLAALAKAQGVVLMEAMWTRYLPATRHLQEKLLPLVGEVRRVYADFSFPIVSHDLSQDSRFLDKAAGAGSLLDQGVYALTWADVALNVGDNACQSTKVVYANSMSVPGVPGSVDDIDTIVLAKQNGGTAAQEGVGIVTTSMTLPGSSKPAFYQRLQATKSAPSVRIEATKASIAIPFPPIRPQELYVQWYDDEHLDKDGRETEELIKKPVERGWGMWYQADVIAVTIASRKDGAEGEVVGEKESMRVLQWMDEARGQAGISYTADLDRL